MLYPDTPGKSHVFTKVRRQWASIVHPMDSPWILRGGGIAVGCSGRYQYQVTGADQAGFVLDTEIRLPLGAVDQKIVAVLLPVHVMACCPPIVAKRQRVKVTGQRMPRQAAYNR